MQMHQLDKRLRKMLSVLEEMSVVKSIPLTGIEIAPRGSQEFVPFENGTVPVSCRAMEWYDVRAKIVVPKDFRLQTELTIRNGREQDWEATSTQIVVYIDGEVRQAFDTRHLRLILADKAEPGRTYDLFMQAYAPFANGFETPLRMLLSLTETDENVRQLYYDLKVPWQAAMICPDDDRDRELTLYTLSAALDLLDLRNPHSPEFDASVQAAREFMQAEYYAKRQALPPVAYADCIGHTHIDVAWLWDLHQTRSKAVRTFSTMLALMEKYPDFKFMSSQPVLYKYVKEDMPQVYQRVKEAIKRGQWEPEGGMWLEADCNLTGGESLVRQFLHGQEFFQKEFGRKNHILWLPDVFGYSAALPQIMQQADIHHFLTSKLSWSEFNKSPYDTFLWKGIDGSEVLTHFTPSRDMGNNAESDLQYFTTYNAMLEPNQVAGGWKRFQQKGLDNHYLVSYGYGDGGGGSTDWMIENSRRMVNPLPGCPVVRQTMPSEFFHDLEARVKDNPRLPKWCGELYLEYHRGTYTAMARNKRSNRKTELALREVELWSALAARNGWATYPAEDLHAIWEDTLTLQFHDILPGSSIEKVYQDSKEIYERNFARLDDIRARLTQAIVRHFRADLLAFNSLSFTRDDVIWFDAPDDVTALVDGEGALYPVQRVEGKCCAFVENLAPMSICPFMFSTAEVETSRMFITRKKFETPYFKGEFDDAMRITQMVDLRNGRQVNKDGQALNRIVCYENRPHDYDAWDINIYYDQKFWEVDDVKSVTIVSAGLVLTKLRVKYAFNKSTITQDIVFYSALDRVDFETTVDWQEDHYLLKAHFPVDIFYNEATFDIQYGNVRRATHTNTSWDVARFEVCAHKWADVSEAGYGVSLLNDCKYGHSVNEDGMALTLLKSSTHPNPHADQEVHHFTYSLMPHMGDWRVAATPEMAYMLNVPVYTAPGSKTGATGMTPFCAVDAENVIIEAVKQQLDGTGTIIRLYECYGERTDVTLTLDKKPASVRVVNLLEEDLADAQPKGRQVCFTLKPYEIRTFLVK